MNKLWHSDFDRSINGYSLRGIGMSAQGYKLETKWNKRFKKFRLITFTVFLCFVFVLSAFAVGRWVSWDKGYEFAVKQIYQGNNKQVQQNKEKAMREIAGAGSQGNVKVWEGK